MRFVCDSCRAQYMISDDKVGAKGVKVRCKKCGYNIVVRPAGSTPTKDEGTSTEASASAATAQEPSSSDSFGLPATLGTAPEGGIFSGVEDDELGAVFDQVLNSGSHRIPAGEKVGDGPAQLDVSDTGATVRKLAEAEAGSVKPVAAHEWFVAIDEKQVGPLSMEKVKDHWERG
ncbi:MAG TPA: MJ0042-type zinc finger domain-containing protein, partial [Archangium sp.]